MVAAVVVAVVEAVVERGAGAMALLDAAHWATEAPWLDEVAIAYAFALDTVGLSGAKP